ncbi:uncharacterized protein L203_102409 [Cryptococcus depauperatus CBS 7841]|uniref:Uncharacterized protein n=1 Tax=Cryptococcus depauperatus CBS 7841 TaxID=1295531 RepID=A0A1E3IAX7_9TREE|nr:hypothetical protein L203_04868 [Cryptococcus depauperatus CBS 7841]
MPSTRNSPPSPHPSLRPRPTVADVSIAPRHRLRDGSRRRGRSTSSSGSQSGSASSTSGGDYTTIPGTAAGNGMANLEGLSQINYAANSLSTQRRCQLDLGLHRTHTGRGTPQDPLEINDSDNEDKASQGSIVAISPDTAHMRRRYYGREGHAIRPRVIGSPLPNMLLSMPTQGSSTSSEEGDTRRYTAKEKGKGRAEPVTVVVSSDEEDEEPVGVVQPIRIRSIVSRTRGGNGKVEEDHLLGTGYTCPVCFNAPSPAVMTPCGHILCAGCLHSSLTAAIRRNPNPYPNPFANRTAPNRSRGRGRGGYSLRSSTMFTAGPQPAHWNLESLRNAYHDNKRRELEESLIEKDISPEDRAAMVEMFMTDDGGENPWIEIKEVLNGLWRLGSGWVAEGECPVCRKALPGGYGPPGSGIGCIIPLQAKLSRPD